MTGVTSGIAGRLPAFPWDRLQPAKERAQAHPDGIVDLSVGTPVDPVPEVVQQALREAANAPGYPTVQGTLELRRAAVRWLKRRTEAVVDADAVLPVLGTKELVASLPMLLGVRPGQRVVVPELAYPTYDIGARLAGAETVVSDSLLALGPASVSMVWLNSPSNPTGGVLPVEHLRKVVDWARSRGTVVASDECYLELGWEERPVSILHPDVCGGSHDGLLALHSLSKRSNMAGYRAGFVTGDQELVATLLEVRKHLGMMMPRPVQSAMAAAMSDDAHVTEQRARYRQRREMLVAALTEAGFRIEDSAAGLYLWVTRDEPCGETVDWFAERGVLVAPGDFYGTRGGQHVRVALTALDERVVVGCERIVQ